MAEFFEPFPAKGRLSTIREERPLHMHHSQDDLVQGLAGDARCSQHRSSQGRLGTSGTMDNAPGYIGPALIPDITPASTPRGIDRAGRLTCDTIEHLAGEPLDQCRAQQAGGVALEF